MFEISFNKPIKYIAIALNLLQVSISFGYDNSMELHKLLQNSTKNKPRNVITYDFSTLYTSIPHVKLKEEIKLLVEKAYNGMNKKFIKVTKSRSYWSNSKTTHTLAVWLIDNTYVIVGNQVLRQTIGIPMGT